MNKCYLFMKSSNKWVAGISFGSGEVVLEEKMTDTLPFDSRFVEQVWHDVYEKLGELPVKLWCE